MFPEARMEGQGGGTGIDSSRDDGRYDVINSNSNQKSFRTSN